MVKFSPIKSIVTSSNGSMFPCTKGAFISGEVVWRGEVGWSNITSSTYGVHLSERGNEIGESGHSMELYEFKKALKVNGSGVL